MPENRLIHFKASNRRIVIGLAVIAVALICYLAGRNAATRNVALNPLSTHGPYVTAFPISENPISEGGNWINGQAAGADWANIQTNPGFAFGTESGAVRYADSTALLTGAWGGNQSAQARVRAVSQNDSIFEEVELRLRSSISSHRATGYEINFRCSKTSNAYTQIVRWNGRLGKFTILKTAQGSRFGVTDGDIVQATVIGRVITSYINGVQALQTTDSAYQSGNPGMGFYLEGATGVNADFGFTMFAATDGPSTDLQPAAPSRWNPAGLLSGQLSRGEALVSQ